MMRVLYLILIIAAISSCDTNRKFDSEKWRDARAEDLKSDIRESMIEDLLATNLIIGRSIDEIHKILGDQEINSSNILEYLVREKYEWDADPEYIKSLIIELDSNLIANKVYVSQSH